MPGSVSTIARCDAAGSPAPSTAALRIICHCPALPPTNVPRIREGMGNAPSLFCQQPYFTGYSRPGYSRTRASQAGVWYDKATQAYLSYPTEGEDPVRYPILLVGMCL